MPDVGDSKVDQFYVAIGKKIRWARNNAGMSQTTLARMIGFNRSSVANLEAGRQRIALHLFALIAEALNADPAALLPDVHLLSVGTSTLENLNEHLVGTSEKTQDFVRETIAMAPSKPGSGG